MSLHTYKSMKLFTDFVLAYFLCQSLAKGYYQSETSNFAIPRENKYFIKILFLIAFILLALTTKSFAENTIAPVDISLYKQAENVNNSPSNESSLTLPLKQNCNRAITKVVFKPQAIFDEAEDDIIFIHRWANAMHINTKIMTLENEAAFFLKKCHTSTDDIEELERHLRSRLYLRDAEVIHNKAKKTITVTTWDNWSLLPIITLGRKGGENNYSLGIKDRNLLGLGIDTEIESYQNSQRSGYKIMSTIPLFQKQNSEALIHFADNDDGKQRSVFLLKHFAGFNTHNAFAMGFNDEQRKDTIFQNSAEQSIYIHKINYKEINYAWLKFNAENSLLRYRLGITQDEHIFSVLSATAYDVKNSLKLSQHKPQNREFTYPWFAIEYVEKDFKKLTNIHSISQIEDFNFGWQIQSKLGLSDGNKEHSAWMLSQINIKKGYELHKNSLLLLDMVLLSDIYKNSKNRILIRLNTEYFYQLNEHWSLYLNNVNVHSNNQYVDRPVTIGGNTGLRGFPLQYQHGNNSVKITSEIRYYPNINLFKLFDIAGVAFFDTGRAFGDSLINNTETSWLSSVGVGIRIFSPHSGGSNHIIHIDFAFPQSSSDNINNLEIQLQAKKYF